MARANESATNFPGSDVFKKVLSEFFPVTVEHFEEDLSVGLSVPAALRARAKHRRLHSTVHSRGRMRIFFLAVVCFWSIVIWPETES